MTTITIILNLNFYSGDDGIVIKREKPIKRTSSGRESGPPKNRSHLYRWIMIGRVQVHEEKRKTKTNYPPWRNSSHACRSEHHIDIDRYQYITSCGSRSLTAFERERTHTETYYYFFHIGPAIQCAYLILPLSLARRLAVPMYNVKKIAVELKVRWITSRTNYVMFSVLLSPLNSACLSMASINSCRRRLFFLTDFVALTFCRLHPAAGKIIRICCTLQYTKRDNVVCGMPPLCDLIHLTSYSPGLPRSCCCRFSYRFSKQMPYESIPAPTTVHMWKMLPQSVSNVAVTTTCNSTSSTNITNFGSQHEFDINWRSILRKPPSQHKYLVYDYTYMYNSNVRLYAYYY